MLSEDNNFNPKQPGGTILIVDDSAQICRVVGRALKNYFDNVLTAISPDISEKILEENVVEFLVCDFNLGDELPTGKELVVKWKHQFRSIRKAVLFTGSPEEVGFKPPEIDEVVGKGGDKEKLYSSLGIH